MLVEAYYPQLMRDIKVAEEALKAASLPETVRSGLQGELKKLQDMLAALNGSPSGGKNVLASLRADLRWRRVELQNATTDEERERLKDVLQKIASDIRKHSKTPGRKK